MLITTQNSDIMYQIKNNSGEKMNIQVGDKITMKKPHPCGCKEFSVLRVGIDFKIKCEGCGREVMVPRSKLEKNIKGVNLQQRSAKGQKSGGNTMFEKLQEVEKRYERSERAYLQAGGYRRHGAVHKADEREQTS